MKNVFELNFPLLNEMMTTVRLAVGGVCAMKGMDLDASEDCKVCVTESLLLLKHRGYLNAHVCFYEDGGLRVRISGEGEGKAEETSEDDISLALLNALLSDLETEEQDGKLSAVTFACGEQA